MSGGGIDPSIEAHSHTQKHDDITRDFWELVRSVEALKISHNAKTYQMKHEHGALKKIVLSMGMEATVNKRNQAIVVYVIVAMICYMAMQAMDMGGGIAGIDGIGISAYEACLCLELPPIENSAAVKGDEHAEGAFQAFSFLIYSFKGC
ncbi:hypothetical protein ACLOJK_007867 [Asimina triloba]